MKRPIIVLMLILIITMCSSCASTDANMNKFIQKVNENQSMVKEQQGIYLIPFYDRTKINENDVYEMPESNYLVMYHDFSLSDNCKNMQEKLELYMKNKRSFPVYTVVATDGITKLEFIHRKGNNYTVEKVWHSADDIEKLPVKFNKKTE